MFPSTSFAPSSIAVSGYSSRYESQSYSKYEQNPIVSQANAQAEQAEESTDSARAEQFDVSGLVDQIWSFASHRIEDAMAEGASEEELESLWQAAEKGVTAGFSEAKDILDGLGELDDSLALKIDSAYGQLMDKLAERNVESAAVTAPATTAPPAPNDSAGSRVDRAISLYQYQRQTFALDLKTNEGDTIQIRAVNESAASAEDYRFGKLSSTSWSSAQSSGYELIVNGNLNEQEMADLDALLAEVNTLADEFYSGQLDKAFDLASELSIDGTSLMSLDLSLQEVETKGAAVYAQTAGARDRLPAGLVPLRNYADQLVAAQDLWQSRFDSAQGLLDSIVNHPRDNGSLTRFAEQLIG